MTINTDGLPEALTGLIEPGRVHKSLYTDPAIYELEMNTVFCKAWIYVGHESQIPKPGDFYTTRIGKEPIILVRHTDNAVKVLYNRCAHKGSLLTTRTSGNVKAFRCLYHAWLYETDGKFKARPLPDAYDEDCIAYDASEKNLKQVACAESYRGFVFARLHESGDDLNTWLGETKCSIDNLVDRSPIGELEVVGRPLLYTNDCNWKMMVENVSDALHALPTHKSASAVAIEMARQYPDPDKQPAAINMLTPFGSALAFFDEIGQTICGNGHSYSGGKVSIHSAYPEVPQYKEVMHDSYGPAKAEEILGQQRHNTVIYPSVSFKCNLQSMRVFRPISVNETLLETWTFRLKGAPEELLHRTLTYNQTIFSAASVAGHDDNEAFCRMQLGLQSGGLEWVNLNRHMGAEERNDDGTVSAPGTSDLVFRHQFQAWQNYMADTVENNL
ncbi:MAG: benzoate/toluate 1,2-dioxygenase alpha subunit [Halioglobus sp.]|jgi:phenylpropionate dioxygenase-like ring-hydroxylating dioxygenase large terminal subunit